MFKELEMFNWDTKNIREVEEMISKIENYDEETTEDEKIELKDYLEELEDMKTRIENYEEDDFDTWNYDRNE